MGLAAAAADGDGRRETDYGTAAAGTKGGDMASGRSEAGAGVEHLEARAQQTGQNVVLKLDGGLERDGRIRFDFLCATTGSRQYKQHDNIMCICTGGHNPIE